VREKLKASGATLRQIDFLSIRMEVRSVAQALRFILGTTFWGGRMETANKTEHVVSSVGEDAKSVMGRTRWIGSVAADKVTELTGRFGESMRRTATRVRESSPHEKVREATNKLADTMESTGVYLEEKGVHSIVDDAVRLIKRYPTKALLIGLGLGFLFALRSRR
jgi:hypothetical protein